jgi:hypothetical protein
MAAGSMPKGSYAPPNIQHSAGGRGWRSGLAGM